MKSALFASSVVALALGTELSVAADQAGPGDDPRVVRRIVAAAEDAFQIPITFEEPAILWDGDLEDQTKRVGARRRSISPKSERMPILEPVQRGTDPGAYLNRAVSAYSTSGGRARYEVRREHGILHVVPTAARSGPGQWKATVPILDAQVVMPSGPMTGLEALDHLVEQISISTGARVVVGVIPVNVLRRLPMPESPPHVESGRAVLARLLGATGQPFRWSLLYGPEQKSFGLSITPVRRAARTR